LEEIILKNQLYIPKPGELNDPKEARPKIAPASIGEFISMLQTYFIKSQAPMTPAEEKYHREVIDFNLRKYGTDLQDYTHVSYSVITTGAQPASRPSRIN
jgi:hypothetical protein